MSLNLLPWRSGAFSIGKRLQLVDDDGYNTSLISDEFTESSFLHQWMSMTLHDPQSQFNQSTTCRVSMLFLHA